MTNLETILINKQRRNFIAGYKMLSDDYAILMLYANGGTAMAWTYNVVAKDIKDDYEIVTLLFANNIKEAIARCEKIINSTDDFDYSYTDVLSKSGKWYKKRNPVKNDNREYKKRYINLLQVLIRQ